MLSFLFQFVLVGLDLSIDVHVSDTNVYRWICLDIWTIDKLLNFQVVFVSFDIEILMNYIILSL